MVTGVVVLATKLLQGVAQGLVGEGQYLTRAALCGANLVDGMRLPANGMRVRGRAWPGVRTPLSGSYNCVGHALKSPVRSAAVGT